jgi:hypothetical protein
MSFERTPDGLTIGRYYGAKSGTMTEPTSAIAAYFIDILESKFPTVRDNIGDTPITYTWFHSGEPQTTLNSPAVGFSVAPMEVQTLGSTSIATSFGSIIPGSLMAAEIIMVIVADSPRMREDISSKIFKILNKHVHYSNENIPIIYLERKGFGDDRGFSSIDRFVMTSLWQNITEDKYIKIDTYQVGYAENYIEEDDSVDWAVVGTIRDSIIESDSTPLSVTYTSSTVTFKTTFRPNGV